MRLSPIAYFLLLMSSGCIVPIAAASDSNKSVDLPTMVVSATGYKQQALLAPSSITVLDREQIIQRPVADLAEVFRDIPGIAIVDSGVPGMKRLSLRGESARRVLIKINGQPLADHSNYGTPLLIDSNMIERIEVVRGSASVVHGSNAIGGVVNITTRQMHAGEHEIALGGGYYSATRGYRTSAGVLGAFETVDYRLQVSRSEHGDRRIPHDRLDNSDSDTKSVSAELGQRFGQSRVAWQGDYYTQAANAWTDPAKGIDYMSFPERSSLRNALSYRYENADSLLQKINAQLYHHSGTRILETAVKQVVPPMSVQTYNRSDDELTTEGAQFTFESRLLGENVTVFGMEYQRDSLETSKYGETTTQVGMMPPSSNSSNSLQKAEQSFWSAFAQQQIKLVDNVEAHLGVRYYDINSKLTYSTQRSNAKQNEDKLVGSAGLVWQVSEISSFRFNVAQGYTYPSVTQQFAETVGGNDVHFGNPDLKSEKATTYELGARIDGKQWTLDATLYQSHATDFIDRKALTTAPEGYNFVNSTRPKALWQWINVSEADSYGAEVALAYQLQNWRPYTQLSMQERKLTFANGYSTYSSGLPSYMLRAGVQWDVLSNLNIDIFARSYGNAERKDEQAQISDSSQRYIAWNMSAQYQPTAELNITMALNNLTNKFYQNPEELPAAERALDVEVTWRF